MTKTIFAAIASFLLAMAPCAAEAATVHYELSGGATASWDLEQNPVPDEFDGSSFTLNNITGSFPLMSPVNIIFFTDGSSPISGGFALFNFIQQPLVAAGQQLFAGTTAAPILKGGTFVLDGAFFDPSEGQYVFVPDYYTLVVSVPEPEIWGLLIVGFSIAGGAMRRAARHRHRDAAH